MQLAIRNRRQLVAVAVVAVVAALLPLLTSGPVQAQVVVTIPAIHPRTRALFAQMKLGRLVSRLASQNAAFRHRSVSGILMVVCTPYFRSSRFSRIA